MHLKWLAKWSIRIAIAVAILAGLGYLGYRPALQYYAKRNRPVWRTAAVTRGDVLFEVTATGEIKPVQSVIIGSFVSGPIKEIFVDFNQKVTKGQPLAKVDPRLYEANKFRDEAALLTREADVQRVKALLQQAKRDEMRASSLQKENHDFIAQSEVDKYVFNRMQLEAQLVLVEAAVKQARAALDNSIANWNYTDINSPIDGIVIEKKIDTGQTLAASFQAPELFTIAPDMDKKMLIYASVDEADIGYIREAKSVGKRVHFTVDAWPNELFEGEIDQIRFSSAKTQNVVTYPVVVSAANPDLKLMPGMTANLSFIVAEQKSVLRVPRAALRFFPSKERVRAEDVPLVEGDKQEKQFDEDLGTMTSAERMVIKRKERKRHVWIEEGDWLRAIQVEEGISDNNFTEVRSPDLKEGQNVIIGQEDRQRGRG